MNALFLDRDGVLNILRPNDYVKSPDELQLLPGVPEALSILRPRFDFIFVATNQQGIGKGLMSEADLDAIHLKLQSLTGHLIDHIYHCPDLASSHSFLRKPNIGMAIRARHDHPGLRLKDCLMAGDSATDMLFGRRAGMHTLLIHPNSSLPLSSPHLVDLHFPSLIDYAKSL